MTMNPLIKELPTTPPAGAGQQDCTVMAMDAVVDTTPQELRALRPFGNAVAQISELLSPEAQIVLQSIFSCFERQKEIKEGLIGDLVWGFSQCGVPPQCTMVGLVALEKDGYLKFQAPDNAYVDMNSDQIGKAWVRYQKKLLDMVYE